MKAFQGFSRAVWAARGLYISGFNSITRFFCLLPFVDANNPDLKLLVMIPAGALAYFPGTFLRAPFDAQQKALSHDLSHRIHIISII